MTSYSTTVSDPASYTAGYYNSIGHVTSTQKYHHYQYRPKHSTVAPAAYLEVGRARLLLGVHSPAMFLEQESVGLVRFPAYTDDAVAAVDAIGSWSRLVR